MDTSLEARLARLEESVERLAERIDRLERTKEGTRAAAEPVSRRERDFAWEPAAMAPAAEPADRRAPPESEAPWARTLDLEDLLGGRVLAWVGGLAVLLGVVFFLVMAVSRGWIDEPTRVVLAFVGSTALLALGLYLYERRGSTDAAIAAVAAAIAALYASLTAATALYSSRPSSASGTSPSTSSGSRTTARIGRSSPARASRGSGARRPRRRSISPRATAGCE